MADRFLFLGSGYRRQADDEGRSGARTGAVRFDVSVVQLHQSFSERQPDAEAGALAIRTLLDLNEHVEDARKVGGIDADTRIAQRDDCLACGDRCGDRNVPTAIGELHGIVQDVCERLRQPRQICIDPEGSLRQIHLQDMSGGMAQRCRCFERAGDDGSQVDALAAQLDLVARDP